MLVLNSLVSNATELARSPLTTALCLCSGPCQAVAAVQFPVGIWRCRWQHSSAGDLFAGSAVCGGGCGEWQRKPSGHAADA